MARLILPDDFTSQLALLANIIAQNNSLGTESPLTAFLTQQSIVLDDDAAAGNAAQTHDINHVLLSKQSENYRQLRDNSFKTPWSHLTGSAQFLKQFYKGNTKELGNWGIPITDSGKINYPPAFADRLIVFGTFAKKHNAYAPGASPLQPYFIQQNINLANDAASTGQAAANNTSFTASGLQSENETELRNQLWQPVLEHIKTIGSFLMKSYTNNPKALGAWGFIVDNSAQKPKIRTSKIKPGATASFNGLVIGGTLTNIGSGEIHLYRSKTTTGTPAIIHAGEQFGIISGYSSASNNTIN